MRGDRGIRKEQPASTCWYASSAAARPDASLSRRESAYLAHFARRAAAGRDRATMDSACAAGKKSRITSTAASGRQGTSSLGRGEESDAEEGTEEGEKSIRRGGGKDTGNKCGCRGGVVTPVVWRFGLESKGSEWMALLNVLA